MQANCQPLFPDLFSQTEALTPANQVFNIALFGAGRIGRVHARSIADHPATRLQIRRRSRRWTTLDLERSFGRA
jgi:hypothetical protein